MMLLKVSLVFCIIFALHEPLMVSGRGRSVGRSRTTLHRSSHKSSGGGNGGWFSWLTGGSSKSNSASKSAGNSKDIFVPPYMKYAPSQVGFAVYGNNYETNFHNSRSPKFQPTSHPYQSHFQPQTTDVFAYHFIPQTHVHHIFHNVGRQEPVYYDYRNSSLSSTPSPVKDPIIYDYKPPMSQTAMDKTTTSSSEDIENTAQAAHPNDIFIAGVENMLLYGGMKDNQHQVLFIQQDSDGITFENELFITFNNFDGNESGNLQYFPDVEFRFDADDEPNDDDLQNICQMLKDLVDNGRC